MVGTFRGGKVFHDGRTFCDGRTFHDRRTFSGHVKKVLIAVKVLFLV